MNGFAIYYPGNQCFYRYIGNSGIIEAFHHFSSNLIYESKELALRDAEKVQQLCPGVVQLIPISVTITEGKHITLDKQFEQHKMTCVDLVQEVDALSSQETEWLPNQMWYEYKKAKKYLATLEL